jgi:surface polysaccharide O-acyltransferase-like enzyme
MQLQTQRLYFLDWVRIIAFFLLIVYHIGMYYVTWGWHVKSPYASDAIEPLMMLSSPWRLGLLFLVSGVACGSMLMKMRASAFMRSRSARLLVPLLFGMLVIVPPQAYFEVLEQVGYQGSYLDFMGLYLTGYGGFCKDGCLDLPTWNHLWFVAYLWVYCMLLGALMLVLGARFDVLAQRIAQQLCGWKLIALPVAVLGAVRMALLSDFPSTHGLFDDWYNHAQYFPLFLLGALLSRHSAIWIEIDQMRWSALGIALCCWAALIVYFAQHESIMSLPHFAPLQAAMRVVWALCAWCAMLAACGFAHRHLNVDNAQRRYLSQAVFPVYIVHQSLIVSLAHMMKPARIAPVTEALILLVLTVCLSFGIVELVRRRRALRPLFGLGHGGADLRQLVPENRPISRVVK